MNLPQAIRTARQGANLTQAKLARKLGVSPSTVAGWELGTHAIRMDRIGKLARVTGASESDLLACLVAELRA
jgi:transcriptional regulator with XRE-family HTH domain